MSLGQWAVVAVIVAASATIVALLRRADKHAGREQPAYLGLSDVEVLARLEAELNPRRINSILREYDREAS